MRNLKRALSLALASVMLLGMMVVGSGASYADVTSEQNVEAIEVLQAVGVMVGDDNGNFNPDKNVTRNEMAVVMANLMDYRVATYAGTSPFTDVPSWAEPYVAACYTNGITSGTSATTYGGSSTVTAGQAALMLMKALGYFQYASDFGSDWLLATTKVGTTIGLFKGVEAGVREAMTRNDVAQLVLNTLKSTMVEPDDNILNVSTGDVAVSFGSITYYYRVDHTNDADYRAIYGSDHQATGINGTQGTTMELGEELYGGDLKMSGTRDAYGRPSTRWMYGLTEVGYYADEPLAVYTAKVSVGDLYSLVGKSVLDDISRNRTAGEYSFSVYADGEDVVPTCYGPGFTTGIRETYFVNNGSAAAGVGYTNNQAGKGVRTEVYLDGDGNLDIVYINTYLMQATADYNEKNNTLNVSVITAPADFQSVSTPGVAQNGATVGVTQLSGDDFDLKSYKEDAYILYTVADGRVEEIFPAQTVSGKVNAYTEAASVTLDGTKYEYAAKIEGSKQTSSDSVDGSKATEYRVGDNASLILDQYGYVIYVDSAAISLGNYVYVSSIIKKDGFGTNYLAEVYFTDGTTDTVTINKLYDKAGNEETTWYGVGTSETSDGQAFHGWYSYSVNSAGKYTLREADTSADLTVTKLEGEKVQFASGVYGNDNTVLVVDDGDEVKVYTGIKNFPEITAGNPGDDSDFVVTYFKEQDKTSKTYAAVAFVDASKVDVDDSSNETLIYVLDKDSTNYDNEDNEAYDVWNVVLDGKVQQIKTKANEIASSDEYTLFTKYSVDSDGYYTVEDKFSSVYDSESTYDQMTLTVGSEANITVSGSSLKLDADGDGTADYTYVVTDDTEIVVLVMDGNDDLLDDRTADYEVKFVSGKGLNSLLSNYSFAGTFCVITEDDGGNVVADKIVVTVDSSSATRI